MLISLLIIGWLLFNTWFYLIKCYIFENSFIADDLDFADLIIFTIIGIPGALIAMLIHNIKNKNKKVR